MINEDEFTIESETITESPEQKDLIRVFKKAIAKAVFMGNPTELEFTFELRDKTERTVKVTVELA